MANTKQSAKRVRQTNKRQDRNQRNRSLAKTAVRKAVEAIQKKDMGIAKEAYAAAIKALDKAATKGAIPKGRASRKIGRLTQFVKANIPNIFGK